MQIRWGKHKTEPVWHDVGQRSVIPEALQEWLLTTDSLTQKLQARCGGGFHLEILQHGKVRPQLNERRLLQMPDTAWALRREVVLCCDDTPLVFARTVIPVGTLRGAGLRLSRLGRKPLGEVLFRDHSVQRSQWQLTHLAQDHPLFADLTLPEKPSKSAIWGRRSVFLYDGEPLLVGEMFLPAIVGL